MGLDAYVACDCFRRGRLRSTPPVHWGVFVDEVGTVQCRLADEDDEWENFDRWVTEEACEHEECRLVWETVGNIGLVRLLRNHIESLDDDFPVLLGGILYSGSHFGDHLNEDAMRALPNELRRLEDYSADNAETQGWVDQFVMLMKQLLEAHRQTGYPIGF